MSDTSYSDQLRDAAMGRTPIHPMDLMMATNFVQHLLFNTFGPEFQSVPKETHKGLELKKASSNFIKQAKDAEREKLLQKAVDLYKLALLSVSKLEDSREELASLQCKYSEVLCEVGRYEEAVQQAMIGSCINDKSHKVHMQLLKSFEAGNEHHKRFTMAHVLMMQNRGTLTRSESISLFEHLIDASQKFHGGLNELIHLYQPQEWNKTLVTLAEEGAWTIMRTLLIGSDGHAALLPSKSFKFNEINLSGLFTFCDKKDWIEWGEKLVILLIEKGAVYQTLDNGGYSLHAALTKAIHTGSYKLLTHLLTRHIPSGDRNRKDKDGNTILHLALREKYPSKKKAVALLLDYNLDPSITNKDGFSPLDVLPKDDVGRKTLLALLREKGIVTEKLRQSEVSGPSQERSDVGLSLKADQARSTRQTGRTDAYHAHSDVKLWTTDRVEEWLTQRGVKRFDDFDGEQLMEMVVMQRTAPEFFFHVLVTSLKLSFVETLKLSAALREI